MSECYFVGADLHTAIGRGVIENLAALSHAPATPSLVTTEFARRRQTVPYKTLRRSPLPERPTEQAMEARLDGVLDDVIERAIEQAELSADERRQMGLFIGSSSGDIGVSEVGYRDALENDVQALALGTRSSVGLLGSRLRERLNLRGPDYSFNTACTASANALMYADALVRSGELRHALVVGLETFNAITAFGFQGLQLLAADNMKPFDKARGGLVLGEACSALVLGAQAHSETDFYLRGSANLCDTFSMSAANPDGSTIARVIRQALDAAKLEPNQIRALKTHGTASLSNDEAEVAGMRRVFDELPPLCALKPYLGHTLGACGLNELALFCAAAKQGFLIGTPGIAAGDSDLGVTLNQHACDLPPGHFMLNYFGFGGNNTSLVISNRRASS